MATVTFDHRLTGSGWAKARLQIGPASVDLSASYLDDALGDLVRAAAALPSGAEQVRVSWTEEPGEFRWILTARGQSLDVTVLWLDEMWSDDEDHKGRQVLRASCSVHSFCKAVAAGAQRVLDEWGPAGYRAKWGHDFPEESFSTLRAALQTH